MQEAKTTQTHRSTQSAFNYAALQLAVCIRTCVLESQEALLFLCFCSLFLVLFLLIITIRCQCFIFVFFLLAFQSTIRFGPIISSYQSKIVMGQWEYARCELNQFLYYFRGCFFLSFVFPFHFTFNKTNQSIIIVIIIIKMSFDSRPCIYVQLTWKY